jgi:RNA polymerase sigma factor (sigma-70 family)
MRPRIESEGFAAPHLLFIQHIMAGRQFYAGHAMDERTLLDKARRGDVQAFNALVLEYQNQAYSLAYRILGESESAADAAQQAFLSAYQRLADLRGEFRPWLMRIAANACLDELRRQKRRPTTSLEELSAGEDGAGDGESLAILADPAESPEDATQRRELRAALERCLARLAPEMRATVLLADVHALAYEEVAYSLRIAVGTVKSRVARARAGLRDCLRQQGELLPEMLRLKDEALA